MKTQNLISIASDSICNKRASALITCYEISASSMSHHDVYLAFHSQWKPCFLYVFVCFCIFNGGAFNGDPQLGLKKTQTVLFFMVLNIVSVETCDMEMAKQDFFCICMCHTCWSDYCWPIVVRQNFSFLAEARQRPGLQGPIDWWACHFQDTKARQRVNQAVATLTFLAWQQSSPRWCTLSPRQHIINVSLMATHWSASHPFFLHLDHLASSPTLALNSKMEEVFSVFVVFVWYYVELFCALCADTLLVCRCHCLATRTATWFSSR